MRRLSVWLARITLAAASALVPAWAADDPPGRVGRVTDGQGTSWFHDTVSGEWVSLERNRPLTTGDRIAVDEGARLEMRIGSTAVRLAGGSELEITRLDDERIELYLHDGSVAVRVRSPEVAREVEVSGAAGRFSLRGPGHFRVDARDNGNAATSWFGEVHFDGDDSALDIAAGRSAEFWREGANNATHYSWGEPAADEFADWTARANREDDRVALPEQVSPEMTGAEDLNRYGSWDTHPDYGPIWTPTTVVAGWAPYRYGYWVTVSPWGWTWVDYAPWGFAPFHYGRWLYFGGRWCWAPGYRVARPVYSPALVAWVGGAPSVGRGPWPYVGWVPLAPREPYYPHYTTRGSYWRAVNSAQMKMFPPGTPRRVPTGPISYANQGVSGAVSVVPGNTLVPRRPVAPVVAQVDPTIRNGLASQPTRTHVPPPGVARPIAVPGAATGATVPAPPSRPPRQIGTRPAWQPTPAATVQPGQNPDARRSGRMVPPSTSQSRAGGAPTGAAPGQTGQPSAPPRVSLPARPTGPAQVAPAATVPNAPAPTVRAPLPPEPVTAPVPTPRGQPAEPGAPSGQPRAPARSSAWQPMPAQGHAVPAPPATRQPERVALPRSPAREAMRQPERVAAPHRPERAATSRQYERAMPPQVSHAPQAPRGTQRQSQTAPAAQSRVQLPEWRGHPNRAQAR